MYQFSSVDYNESKYYNLLQPFAANLRMCILHTVKCEQK